MAILPILEDVVIFLISVALQYGQYTFVIVGAGKGTLSLQLVSAPQSQQ